MYNLLHAPKLSMLQKCTNTRVFHVEFFFWIFFLKQKTFSETWTQFVDLFANLTDIAGVDCNVEACDLDGLMIFTEE